MVVKLQQLKWKHYFYNIYKNSQVTMRTRTSEMSKHKQGIVFSPDRPCVFCLSNNRTRADQEVRDQNVT